MASGAEKIAAERQRQIEGEGYSPLHDREHPAGELSRAGACYADFAATELEGSSGDQPHPFWPWAVRFWKPADNVVDTLVKAGALIAAEIDRVQALQTEVPPAGSPEAFASTRSADGRFPI